jgi:hypothetical protein
VATVSKYQIEQDVIYVYQVEAESEEEARELYDTHVRYEMDMDNLSWLDDITVIDTGEEKLEQHLRKVHGRYDLIRDAHESHEEDHRAGAWSHDSHDHFLHVEEDE